jgi:hypothetical protein
MSRGASTVARKFVMATKFQGLPKLSDFKIVEEPIAALKNEGVRSSMQNIIA